MNESLYQNFNQADMTNMMSNRIVYPEIFYKLQPYIMNVCDQMDASGYMMPSQEVMEKMSDSIYDDMSRMYPDMVEYARTYDNNPVADTAVKDVINGGPGIFRRNFRRRGLLRDLIEILLLSEFHRRRRRHY